MFDRLLVRKLTLAPGRNPGGAGQDLVLSGLTVFVGPNNAGKSLAISEIYRYGDPKPGDTWNIVTELMFSALSQDQAEQVVQMFGQVERNPYLLADRLQYRSRRNVYNVRRQEAEYALQNPESQPQLFRQLYFGSVTISLNGETRLNLCHPKPFGDLLKPDPFNALQVLFSEDRVRKKVREIIWRAFGEHFIIIPTTEGKLRIAFAPREPNSLIEEQGLHAEARKYYASATPIEQFSDGVRAFTGMIIEVMAGNPRVILIDEPEAFLHPPLAQRIGAEISTVAAQLGKNVFVATHSAHFVMGCIQSGAPVDVVRLTYKNGIATARVLRNDELTVMMRNPLLRSAGVINALFYECVIVTESDSDRAFYEEINDRLLKYAEGRGISNCLFLNAQNKQTTRLITKPLRELGIPTISIVDIDVLKDGGTVWSAFLESGGLPDLDRAALATSRDQLYARVKAEALDLKRGGGITLLKKTDRESATNLCEQLERYGLFVVRGGEVESWLKPLGITGHTPKWLISIFEKLGDDPSKAEFVRPGKDDVWDFVDRMQLWFVNSNRKGMPD